MNDNLVMILAYNESKNIQKTIEGLVDKFDIVLVVNDCSTDSTPKILDNLETVYKNLYILNNKKNMGAGRSFQIGANYIINKLKNIENIIKVDGDGQFEEKDVIQISNLLKTDDVSYIKSNRFWDSGIEGEIPSIRYFGNSLASMLIKFVTGQFGMNDPLNGLMGFKNSFLRKINIPRYFNRYGYPFYINTLSVKLKISTLEINNTVKYNIGEKSQLKAIPVLTKLIYFSTVYFFKNINLKLKDSNLQISGLLDIFFIATQVLSYFALYKLLSIRFFNVIGIQSNWLIIFLIIQIFSFVVIYYSKSLENNYRSKFINFLNL